jgi:uncharacterized membrane protein YphA (DoxX/SURF4 family)
MSIASISNAKIGWLTALSPQYLRAPSVIVLVVANLFPLYGVLYLGWDLYTLMVLYWMETGIIGVFAILEMALAARLLALILVPFFIVHFGGFMLGHILFLTLMFGGGVSDSLSEMPDLVWKLLVERGLWIAFGALFISHGASFALNVVRPAWHQWRQRAGDAFWQATLIPSGNPQAAMVAPYQRIVVMHVTIIAGAFLVEIFKTRAAAFVLLIMLKIVVDVAAHVRKNLRPSMK